MFTGATRAALLALLVCVAALAVPAGANAAITGSLSVTPSSLQAGGHPTVDIAIRPSGDTLRDIQLDLPPGLVPNPEAATSKCTTTQWQSDSCPSASTVGSSSTEVTALGFLPQTASGTVYQMVADPTDTVTMGIVIRPSLFFFIPLGKLYLKIHVTVRPDGGLRNVINNIPNSTSGISFSISRITMRLNSRPNSTTNYFTHMPHSCGANTSNLQLTSYSNTTGTAAPHTFTTTGCDATAFDATPSTTIANTTASQSFGIKSVVETPTADQTIQSSYLKQVAVKFPAGTGLDFTAIGAVPALCGEVDFAADTCPAGADIGNTDTIVRFVPPSFTGDIYLMTRGANITFGVILRGARNTKAWFRGNAGAVDADGDGVSDYVQANIFAIPQFPNSPTTLDFVSRLMIHPDTCGPKNVEYTFTGQNGKTVTKSNSYSVTNCPPPETTITSGPPSPTNDNTADFTFTSNASNATFECSVDSTVYSPCASPYATAPLADGSHTFRVRAVANGLTDATPPSATFTVDTVKPTLTVSSPAEGATVTTSTVSVVFSAESGSAVTCSTDGGAAATCASPYSTGTLADGAHSVTVNARDAAGNVNTVTRNFTVSSSTPPPPPAFEVTITSGPANGSTITTATATFAFTSNKAGTTYKCQVDGGRASSCTSPFTTKSLANGSHTFTVTGTNGSLTDSDARTFTVNTGGGTTFTVTITSGPTEGATISDNTPTFEFTASATATFTCKVDAGTASACGSPHTTATLADGSHTFTVTGKTGSGKTAKTASASRTFTVSTGGSTTTTGPTPDTTITSGPAAGSTISTSTATFQFTSTQAGSTFQCQVDSGTYASCSSPHTTATLADGAHTFYVRATYNGATDPTPASRSFNVCASSSCGGGGGTTPNTTITVAPGTSTADTTPTYEFASSVSGSTFQCSVDGGAYSTCTSPYTTSALSSGVAHTVRVRATASGLTDSTPAAKTTWVDTRTFAVTAAVTASTTQAAGHPTVSTSVAGQGAFDPFNATLTLPRGLNGSIAAVATKCTVASALAGTCATTASGSLIGTGTGQVVTTDYGVLSVSGSAYMTDAPSTANAAGVAVKATLMSGTTNLGDVIVLGAANLVNNGFNQEFTMTDIPNGTTTGVAFHVLNITATLNGSVGGSAHPLVTNPSQCPSPAAVATGIVGAYLDGIPTAITTTPYPVTGCNTVPFQPTMRQTYSSPAAGTGSGVTAVLDLPMNNASVRQMRVSEPPFAGPNFNSFGDATLDRCPSASASTALSVFNPSGCPAQAQVGTMTLTTPLLLAPITGKVYYINKSPLPWLGVHLTQSPGIDIRLVATTTTNQYDPTCTDTAWPYFCGQTLQIYFQNLPDTPVTQVSMRLGIDARPGGTALPKEVLQMAAAEDMACVPNDGIYEATPYTGTAKVTMRQPLSITGCAPVYPPNP